MSRVGSITTKNARVLGILSLDKSRGSWAPQADRRLFPKNGMKIMSRNCHVCLGRSSGISRFRLRDSGLCGLGILDPQVKAAVGLLVQKCGVDSAADGNVGSLTQTCPTSRHR